MKIKESVAPIGIKSDTIFLSGAKKECGGKGCGDTQGNRKFTCGIYLLNAPERVKSPFPLNYPIAQADGAVKVVYGTGTAVFAVRIRSELDGAGGAVLDTLIIKRRCLGKKRSSSFRVRFTAAAELRIWKGKQKTTFL